jgi:hypothetical protein
MQSGDTLDIMRPPAQTYASAVLALILVTGLSGCVTPTQPETGPKNQLATCDEILPGKLPQDLFGRSATVVQLHEKEHAAVNPLVDEMITNGIACGGLLNETVMSDGAVVIGQLAMDEKQWTAIQSKFTEDGHEVTDEIVKGWVNVSKPDADPTLGSGFAWRDGVLYYLQTPFLLELVSPFASEVADNAPAS